MLDATIPGSLGSKSPRWPAIGWMRRPARLEIDPAPAQYMPPPLSISTLQEYARPFLFGLTSRGFYSEINHLLNALLYGLVTRRRLVVDASRFAGGDLAWSDLYESLLPSASADVLNLIPPAWRIADHLHPGFQKISRAIGRWHRWRRFFLSDAYGFHRNVFAAKRCLALQFCQPISALKMPDYSPTPYAALHVRRGDKTRGYFVDGRLVVEGEETPPGAYLSIVRRKAPHVRRLFVMTDDHSILAGLKSLAPNMEIDSFCGPAEQGYQQGEFNLQPGQTKTQAVQRLITEVEIAARSQLFVGCYQSNVSRYVALIHRHPRNCFSVDRQKRWHPL